MIKKRATAKRNPAPAYVTSGIQARASCIYSDFGSGPKRWIVSLSAPYKHDKRLRWGVEGQGATEDEALRRLEADALSHGYRLPPSAILLVRKAIVRAITSDTGHGDAAAGRKKNPGFSLADAQALLDKQLTESLGAGWGTFSGETRQMPSGAWRIGVLYPKSGRWYWTIWPNGRLKGEHSLGGSRDPKKWTSGHKNPRNTPLGDSAAEREWLRFYAQPGSVIFNRAPANFDVLERLIRDGKIAPAGREAHGPHVLYQTVRRNPHKPGSLTAKGAEALLREAKKADRLADSIARELGEHHATTQVYRAEAESYRRRAGLRAKGVRKNPSPKHFVVVSWYGIPDYTLLASKPRSRVQYSGSKKGAEAFAKHMNDKQSPTGPAIWFAALSLARAKRYFDLYV